MFCIRSIGFGGRGDVFDAFLRSCLPLASGTIVSVRNVPTARFSSSSLAHKRSAPYDGDGSIHASTVAAEIDDNVPVTIVRDGQAHRRNLCEATDVFVALPASEPIEVDLIEESHVCSTAQLDNHYVASVGIEIVVEELHDYLFFLPEPYGD